jgi:hypothetical protein
MRSLPSGPFGDLPSMFLIKQRPLPQAFIDLSSRRGAKALRRDSPEPVRGRLGHEDLPGWGLPSLNLTVRLDPIGLRKLGRANGYR